MEKLEIGKPFNPFNKFTGVYVPEPLLPVKGLSPGAKLCYGRLMRYAGQNGLCFPSVPALSKELGVSDRQTQIYLEQLEGNGLIRREKADRKTNNVHFLWHEIFVAWLEADSRRGERFVTHKPRRGEG